MSDLVAGSASLTFEVREPEVDSDTIRLRYALRDGEETVAEYTETIGLPSAAYSDAGLGRLPRLLALAASLSYYKAYIPPTFEVAFPLSPSERIFLSELIRNGLSEFAYRNSAPGALRPSIQASDNDEVSIHALRAHSTGEARRALVAVGGGKDSIVTLEAIRSAGIDQTLFSVNDYLPIRRTAERADLPLVQATRKLDPLLFEHNKAGALNGHVPVTAINSLIACIVALRDGFTDVVFSNEASASAGNTLWEGVEVNHQWSKGLAFEALLSQQVAHSGIRYFSLLRPFTELAIMRRFGQLTEFHDVFTSCNRAFHLDPEMRRSWCGDCPKCRFVFLMLAPFIDRDALLAIFSGRDLLRDKAQREGFLELFNIDGRMKPFECVGEPNECLAALHLMSSDPAWADLDLLELDTMSDAAVAELFTTSPAHRIPPEFADALHAIQ
ncbi:MAG: hypothetical protein ACTHJM_02785 [Marmoricola sp.]